MSTLLEEIGGEQSLKVLVGKLYSKMVRDKELLPFFGDLLNSPTGLKELEENQAKFLSLVLGQGDFGEYDLRRIHQKLVKRGLNDHHFELLKTHLHDCLKELSVSESLCQQILRIVESTRDDVLDR